MFVVSTTPGRRVSVLFCFTYLFDLVLAVLEAPFVFLALARFWFFWFSAEGNWNGKDLGV